jgi:hypothetical protein
MATVTKTRPAPTRLEKAVAALEKARGRADALRARQLESGDVDAVDFGDAGHALELAGLELQGATEAADREAAAARTAQLAAIRKEIETSADPDAALAAFHRVEAGIADLVRLLGPARNRRISRWLTAVRDLDVPETVAGSPAKADAGLGWHGAGMGGSPRVRVDDRAVAPIVLPGVIRAAAARGCTAAEEHPGVADAMGAPAALLKDPESWFRRNA